MLLSIGYLAIAMTVFFATRARPIFGLIALVIATPFDASIAIGPTTATVPKVVVLSVIAALAIRGDISPRALLKTPLFLAAAAVVVATVLTIFSATYHGAVLRETAKALLYLLTMSTAFFCYRRDADYTLLRGAICAITAIVAVGALSQEWTGAPSVFLSEHGLVPRIAGVLDGPNQLAGFFDVTLSWVLVQAVYAQAASRFFIPPVLITGYIALFLTFSRGGIVATSVTAILILAIQQAWFSRTALIWFGASLSGLLIDVVLSRGASHLFSVTDSGDTGALGHRSELWRAAWYFFAHHPWLGIGAGNYERELALAGYPRLHDHANSLYLQALAEGGIVLFSATLGVFAAVYQSFARNAKSSPLAAGALAATIALALHQSVDFLEFYPKVATLWWIILGVAVADHLGTSQSTSKSPL